MRGKKGKPKFVRFCCCGSEKEKKDFAPPYCFLSRRKTGPWDEEGGRRRRRRERNCPVGNFPRNRRGNRPIHFAPQISLEHPPKRRPKRDQRWLMNNYCKYCANPSLERRGEKEGGPSLRDLFPWQTPMEGSRGTAKKEEGNRRTDEGGRGVCSWPMAPQPSCGKTCRGETLPSPAPKVAGKTPPLFAATLGRAM